MNDQYMEAYDSMRSDEHNGDRELAYEKQEAQDDGETIMSLMEKIEQSAKELKELVEGEKFSNYFWDEKHAL